MSQQTNCAPVPPNHPFFPRQTAITMPAKFTSMFAVVLTSMVVSILLIIMSSQSINSKSSSLVISVPLLIIGIVGFISQSVALGCFWFEDAPLCLAEKAARKRWVSTTSGFDLQE
jgi:hypothetical protein